MRGRESIFGREERPTTIYWQQVLSGAGLGSWALPFIFAKLSFMVGAEIENESRRSQTTDEQGQMVLILLKKNTLHCDGRCPAAKKLAASLLLALEN